MKIALAQDSVPKDSDPEAAAVDYRTGASQLETSQFTKYAMGQNCSNCNMYYADSGAPTGTYAIALFEGRKGIAAITASFGLLTS